MELILVKYRPKPNHMGLIRTFFIDFDSILGSNLEGQELQQTTFWDPFLALLEVLLGALLGAVLGAGEAVKPSPPGAQTRWLLGLGVRLQRGVPSVRTSEF